MTNIQYLDHETIAEVFGQMVSGSRKSSMKVVYAKRPTHDANTGATMADAGWVTWTDNETQPGGIPTKMAMGWRPLYKYGTINAYSDSGVSQWAQILQHKDGPSEFPVEQLLEFGWYDPERLRRDTGLTGIRFPQLRGQTIRVIPCPDCNTRTFLKPIHLAVHCRNTHNYDRADIQALGRELNIDFAKELYKDRPREYVYDYADAEPEEPEPALPPDVNIELTPVRGRAQQAPPKPARAPMSDAQKQVLRDRLAAGRAAKAAKKVS